MTEPLRQLGPRTVFTVLIAVVVVGAGWYVPGRALDDTLVAGQVTGASLVWRPGMNSGGAEQQGRANTAEARRLAQLINNTRERSNSLYSCPADFGTQVRVIFEGMDQDQEVVLALTGCAGPPGRTMSNALQNDLERLAPPGFWPQHRQ